MLYEHEFVMFLHYMPGLTNMDDPRTIVPTNVLRLAEKTDDKTVKSLRKSNRKKEKYFLTRT